MAIITLTVSDDALGAGSYNVKFSADQNEIDDGLATGAYFTAFFLHSIVPTEGFSQGATEFGRRLIEIMTVEKDRSATLVPAKVVLTLEDKDIETGRFSATLESFGGDPSGESLPTEAQIVGAYMRALLSDMEFRNDCWKFAEEFAAAQTGSYIVNAQHGPIHLPSSNDDCIDRSAA